jgi:hypothetical protein
VDGCTSAVNLVARAHKYADLERADAGSERLGNPLRYRCDFGFGVGMFLYEWVRSIEDRNRAEPLLFHAIDIANNFRHEPVGSLPNLM